MKELRKKEFRAPGDTAEMPNKANVLEQYQSTCFSKRLVISTGLPPLATVPRRREGDIDAIGKNWCPEQVHARE